MRTKRRNIMEEIESKIGKPENYKNETEYKIASLRLS